MAKPVVIKFVSDIAKALRDIDRLEKRMDKINSKAAKGAGSVSVPSRGGFIGSMMGGGGMGSVGTALSGLTGSAGNLITSFASLNPVVIATTVALLGFIGILKKTFQYGNVLEQSKIVLKSVYNSEKRAVETLQGMREFSRKTQFQPDEVVGATTMMAKYNVNPFGKGEYGLGKDKHVMDLMAGIAAMPGMGGKPLGLDRAVNSVIAGRDIRPIKALGPEAMAAYTKAKGSGMSGSPEFIKTMLTELAKVPKFMALANEQADSMKGLWSTITGFTEEFFMDLSGAGEETGLVTFWSQIKDILKDVRDGGERFVKYIGPYMVELGTYMGASLKFVWNILKQIWQIVGPVLVPAFKIIVQLFRILWEVGKAIMNTFISLAKIVWAVVSAPLKLLATVFRVSNFIDNILSGLMEFVTGLQITFLFLGIFMEGLVNSVSKWLDGFVEDWARVFDEIGIIVDQFVAEHLGPIKDILDFFNKNGGPADWGANAGTATRKWITENGPGLDGIQGGNPLDNAMKGITNITDMLPSWAKGKQAERWEREQEANKPGYGKSGNTVNQTVNIYEAKPTDIENVVNQSGKQYVPESLKKYMK